MYGLVKFGQMRRSADVVTFDAATDAWAAQVVTNGGSVSAARKTIVNTLIVGLKADGIWTKLDRLWLLAAENSQSALTDLKGLVLATANGSPTFTVDVGYTGTDATNTKYLDSNTNLSTLGGTYTLNSAHISTWCNNIFASSSNGGMTVGISATTTSANQSNIFPKYSDGNSYYRINDLVAASGVANASNSTGFYVVNRSSSTLSQGYRNGVNVSNPNATSGALQNGNIYILANHQLSPPGQTSTFGGQVSIASVGGSLSSTDVTNLYNRLATYMGSVFATAWAAQVVSNGGTVSAGRLLTVATLIGGLLADGLWYKLERLWILAAENSQSALTDLKALTLATAINSPTFTTDRGYTGEDLTTTTKYVNTGFSPINGVQYAQNLAHMSAWSVANVASTNGGALAGILESSDLSIYDTFTDGNVYGRINDGTGSGSQGAPGTRAGHWFINRTTSTATQLYQNASLFSSPNATSGTRPTGNVYITCVNSVGTGPVNGTPNQVAMGSFGSSFSSTEVTNFYNRLRTYMTAVGVP